MDRPSPQKKFRSFVLDEEPAQHEEEGQFFENTELFKESYTQTDDDYINIIEQYKLLQEENKKLKRDLNQKNYIKSKFVEHVILSDEFCNHYTGLPTIDVFKGILMFLNLGDNEKNVVLYNNQEVKGDSQRGRPRTLSPLESVLLTLIRLRRNFDICHLSYLFQVSQSAVTNTILTWVNFMFVKFGSICIWPTREQVQAVMPQSMKDKFPNVRCIIDCVEFKVAVPGSPFYT